MAPKKQRTSALEMLPQELCLTIVSMVAAHSSHDYTNTILAAKCLSFPYRTPCVAKVLNLTPLINNPRLASTKTTLMDTCLKYDNMDAHYVKGIFEYFLRFNVSTGMDHIRIAAEGGHTLGRFVYGLLLMANGHTNEGKTTLNLLTDERGITAVEGCWKSIQASLSGNSLSMEEVYVATLVEMRPDPKCHPQESNTVCYKCYHFYLMNEFFELVMGINPPVENQ